MADEAPFILSSGWLRLHSSIVSSALTVVERSFVKSPMHPGRPLHTGIELLHEPALNKSTAFSEAERDALKIRGLLPPRVFTLAEQQQRIMENFERKESDLERYIYMVALQDRNETLFYRTLVDHIERMLPIIYTPTVGEACRQFGHIFRRPRGLYVSARDAGRIPQLLHNWPERDIGVVVVTDGERILGLGDLGAYGMGIPIGKLSLYTACAGIHPRRCLPVMLDVGTDNDQLLEDSLYIGVLQRRLRGQDYADLVEEFMVSVAREFPGALIQFEDFATANALRILREYRDRFCAFNDDIQGTAGVVLAALIAAGRLAGQRLTDQRLMFLGAGAAAVGIADLAVAAMVEDGLTQRAARDRCWLVDRRGLVVSGEPNRAEHKLAYAHPVAAQPDLLSATRAIRPTAIIGVSGHAGGFNQDVIHAMADLNARPVILALSNPTSHSECSAEQAYAWSGGSAIFASGSPFGPVRLGGETFTPAQANNVYIFPGLGLGVLLSGARRVTETMFAAAARCLAGLVQEEDLRRGTILPPLADIRQVSAKIAGAVIQVAQREELSTVPLPLELESWVQSAMYQPEYVSYA